MNEVKPRKYLYCSNSANQLPESLNCPKVISVNCKKLDKLSDTSLTETR